MDVQKWIAKTGKEFHWPGYQYMGPGTHLAKRLKRGDPGINRLDQIVFPVALSVLQQTGSIFFPVALIVLRYALSMPCAVALLDLRHAGSMFFPVTLLGHRYELSMCFSVLFFGGDHFRWVFGPVSCTFGHVA